jgi:hypothetical protein
LAIDHAPPVPPFAVIVVIPEPETDDAPPVGPVTPAFKTVHVALVAAPTVIVRTVLIARETSDSANPPPPPPPAAPSTAYIAAPLPPAPSTPIRYLPVVGIVKVVEAGKKRVQIEEDPPPANCESVDI